MFKTKIRGFTFGLIMSYAMAIGMEIYNMALKYGFQAQPGGLSGLSYAAVGEALTETLYMGLLVLLFSNLWGNRAGDAFRRRHCDAGRDNPYFCRLLRQGGTVAVMCPTMSLAAAVLFNVILSGESAAHLPVIWLELLCRRAVHPLAAREDIPRRLSAEKALARIARPGYNRKSTLQRRDSMAITVERYTPDDLPALTAVWNEVVREGVAFPQLEELTPETSGEFFAAQDFTAVAKDGGEVLGLYILHPNNVGRCGHQANASYAVASAARGRRIGEALVRHSLATAAELGYRLLIFNAVVASNTRAIALYERLGFRRIGTVPGGFLLKDGSWSDTILFYHEL